MHGTGMFTGFSALSKGAPIVLTRSMRFDAPTALDAMTRHQTGGMAIVGDAFAKPLLDALRAEPSRYDVRSMKSITSSGMMWSPEVKQGLFEFMPDVALFDSFGHCGRRLRKVCMSACIECAFRNSDHDIGHTLAPAADLKP